MAVYGTDLLWGCPQINFKVNPPFAEIRQGFATFKKEIRMTPISSQLFENLRFFLKQKFCKQIKLDASF